MMLTISSPMRACASWVAAPMWGVQETRGWLYRATFLRALLPTRVQACGPDLARLQRLQQGRLHPHWCPGGVDDDDAVFHLGNALRINESAAVHCGGVDADEIGLSQQFLHFHVGDAHLLLNAGDVVDVKA